MDFELSEEHELIRQTARDMLTEAWQAGPVIVSEFDTAIVVPPDFSVKRDKRSNVVMSRKAD